MINKPSILIADEPTGELNSRTADKMMDLIKCVGNHCTVLIASNNHDLGRYFPDIFSLKDGIIKENK